jgi:hypothetical protein
MARTVIVITEAHLKIADSEAGLSAAPDFQCQVTSAAITAVPNTQEVPATFCEAASSVPAATGWQLDLAWLQDWTVASGLSEYAFDNDALPKWFSLSLSDAATPLVVGQAYVVAGAYGGDAGTPLAATATWPLLGKPTLTPTAAAVAAEDEFATA